jgi:hypothetical protein
VISGTFSREFTPPLGVELMGYGARVGRADRVHDPLHARALFLGPAPDAHGAGVLVVSAELCLIAPVQALEVRRRIGVETGLPERAILVGCTHTHSGPDTGLGALLGGRPVPAHVAPILDAMVDAGVGAHRARGPARLRWLTTRAAIGRNRRIADGPLDTEVLVLDVRGERGQPLACLFNYACHGTVLGHDNLAISADWPGVASAAIERARGGAALFSLGAHADIDPRTRGLMDLAIDGQSRGLGFDAIEALGGDVAEAVLGVLETPGDFDPAPALGAAADRVELPVHYGERSPEQAEAELARRRAELAERLGVSADELPRTADLYGFARERVRGLAPSEARERLSAMRLYVRDRTARMWVGGGRAADVEVQVLRIGELRLLALPLELTTAVGLDWKARVRSRGGRGAVASIANGWLRYLPHPADLAHPKAHQHYEVLMAGFAPQACERLLERGERLLGAL